MEFRSKIDQRREEFDRIESVPSQAMWMGIQQRRQRRIRRRKLVFTAAAAVLLACVVIPFTIEESSHSVDEEIALSPKILETEKEYMMLAANKKAEIQFDDLDNITYGELIQELDTLDAMYAKFKEDLVNLPDAEEMIASAIRFHERRLRILELLEKEIENHKRMQQYEQELML